MSTIQIIVTIFIIACVGGASSILTSGWVKPQTKKKVSVKTAPIPITHVSYKPVSINPTTGVIDMQPERKKIELKL